MPHKDKEVRQAYVKAWYEKHKEEVIARSLAWGRTERGKSFRKSYSKEYDKKNRDRRLALRRKRNEQRSAYNRKWRAENRLHVRARDNAYNARNREHQRELSRERYKKDPLRHIMQQSKRRVLKLKASGSCSKSQLTSRFSYFGWRCVYCKKSGKLEADHMIPLTRGGTNWPSNFAPACVRCNRKKSTKTFLEFKRGYGIV